MPASMAGASTKGQVAARAVTLSRLSAIPWASLAKVLALTGAMSNKSASWANPICTTCPWPDHKSWSV